MAAAGLFTACSDSDDWTPGEADNENSAGVYFSNENPTSFEIKTETSFDITVMRTKGDQAATVALSAECPEAFTVPSSVSFEAGQTKTALTISYDLDAVEYGTYNIDITIAEPADATIYGSSSISLTVKRPEPWTSLGMATYVEDFLTTFFSVSNEVYEVEIQEHALTPGLYRLVNPYGEAYPNNEPGDYDESADYFMVIHAENPDAVWIGVQNMGFNWGYGDFYMGSIAGLYIENGTETVESAKEKGMTGTLKDGIITFPAKQLLIAMAEYNGGGLYTANGSGSFKVVMPGVVLADYSLDVAYAGKYSGTNDVVEGVMAQLTEVGEDVESIRYAVVEGNDAAAAVEAVVAGAVEYVEADPATATVMVPFGSEPVEGFYILAAVAYAGGEAQSSAYATFKYTETAKAETWAKIGTGDYVYAQFFEGVDEGLELFRSETNPNRFKLEQWGYGVDFCFTYDAYTGEVVVDEQEIGYTDSTYGAVWVSDVTLYDEKMAAEVGNSFYEDGTFYFAVVYKVSAGYFGYGYEAFTISEAAAAKTRSQSYDSISKEIMFSVKSASVHKNAKRIVSDGQLIKL